MPVQESNNFVITGIPRSGTSLLCNLVNHIENVVCFNELAPFYQVDSMPSVFHHTRSALRSGKPVPMKVSQKTGKEITDTQSQEFSHEYIKIDIDQSKKLVVGSNINVPYLLQIDKILSYGYKVIFVTRDPVYAIASWNKHSNINEQYVMDSDFEKWPRYKEFGFKSKDKIGRQVELYGKLKGLILNKFIYADNDMLLFKYEDIVKDPELHLNSICSMLDIDFVLKKELPELKNLNRDSRFPEIDLDEIREKLND